ncbi:MAG: putative amidase [Ilumatobacteraceae bacterium]|nr:putative amidase [Ilumatobacteraceae bacterium]
MGNELWSKGALELAEMIADRQVSSVEVVEAHLARIDAVNPALNAIVRRMDDSARAAAAAADRAVASGQPLGAFHGVPFSVKENIDVAGTPTTSALAVFAEAIVTTDAPVVERMKAAGAIVIGRTNLPDLGLRVATESSLHGITRNPWNAALTAGGSSGGEASSLASGMSPIGLGNDIGGSLRNPAHCCGIASIKPSTGVVPGASELPPDNASIMFQLMAVEGVMARSVADVRAGLLTVAGPHARDPLALPVRLADVDRGRTLRVAVMVDPPGGATHPEIVAAVRHAADVLSDHGADVVDATPPSYERAIELWGALLMADITEQLPLLEMVMGADGLSFLRAALDVFPVADLSSFSSMLTERLGVEKQFQQFFDQYDVLLGPTWAQPPFAHGADVATADGAVTTFEIMRPVVPANLLGLPTAVVPVGMAAGTPVGAQLTAQRFADLRCLSVAQLLEDALGTLTPIDPR